MTDTTNPTALDLLKRAEALLSALHGSVARHDNLAANLGCAGCELRDQISAALPSLAAAPAVLPPAADRAAVERVRAVLETEAVVGRSALEYRGLIASALMADEEQQPTDADVVEAHDLALSFTLGAHEAQQPDDYEATTGHAITCLAVAGGASDPDCPACHPKFGVDGCTCIPFTRQTDPPRYLNRPTDTVDMISGWEPGSDCPHHAPPTPLAKIVRWVESEPVTANTEFGNGYRECQRDIRDLIKGRFDYDPQPTPPAVVAEPGKENSRG